MDWITVYDCRNESLRIGWMFIPVSFVFIGYGFSAFNIFFNQSKGIRRTFSIIFGILFGTSSLFSSVIIIPHNISTYYETKRIYESHEYKVVEGVVADFSPMPYGGHRDETFALNGMKFSYSDFDKSYYGFNNTQSHGGPIGQNKKVRLSYFVSEGKYIILKIEIQNEYKLSHN
jgi:hypothetical protein